MGRSQPSKRNGDPSGSRRSGRKPGPQRAAGRGPANPEVSASRIAAHSALHSRDGVPPKSEDVGKFATVLSRTIVQGTVWAHLEPLLAYLQGVAGADACELFLEEPDGGDLLMMGCTGVGRDALLERIRFKPGVGYPGLIQAHRAPILTNDLPGDPRFLRSRVVREGFRSYACVPLFGPGATTVGSLHLAWRGTKVDLDDAAGLLLGVSPLLGTALYSECSSSRSDAASRMQGLSNEDAPIRFRAILNLIQARAEAQQGTLLLFDPETGRRRATITTSRTAIPCLCGVSKPWQCCAMRDRHGVLRTRVLPAEEFGCPALPDTTTAQCCLPLVDRERVVGAVLLEYTDERPRPALSGLPQLLAATSEIGRFVPDARPVRRSAPRRPPGKPKPRAASKLFLRCLGPFEVWRNGELIGREAFGRRRAIDLLKMLVLKGGQPVSSYVLQEWLWPDSEEESATNRLFGTVHVLRNVLEPGRDRRRSSLLLSDSGQYRLMMDTEVTSDLLVFRAEIETARHARRQGRVDDACRSFKAAVELYQGDLFEDDPYAEWCAAEVREARHHHLDALGFLASTMQDRSEFEQAARYLRRALRWEPLREDLHRQLVGALLALGQRREAREQYRECLWLLKSELQTDPLPETLQLEELIRRA